ncbi:MAG: hypothetical protein AAF198_13370 [Pseudomonadota bacterium]
MTQEAYNERIEKWRAERAKQAEEQRAERIASLALARNLKDQEIEDEAAFLLEQHNGLDAYQSERHAMAKSVRRVALKRAAFSIGSVISVALIWGLIIAAPLYHSTLSFVVLSPQGDTAQNSQTLFIAQDMTDRNHGAFLAQAYIESAALSRDMDNISFANSKFLAALPPWTINAPSQQVRDAHLDIQSGIVALSVWSKNSATAAQTAENILAATSERLNAIYSARSGPRVKDAQIRLDKAEDSLRTAVLSIQSIRYDSGELDPDARLEAIYTEIRDLSMQKSEAETQLRAMQFYNGNDTLQADRLRRQIYDFETRIAALKDPASDKAIAELSNASMQIRRAELSVKLAEENLALARQRFEDAVKSASLSLNLTQLVAPVEVQKQQAYPHIPTLLAFAAMLGFILYASMQLMFPARVIP